MSVDESSEFNIQDKAGVQQTDGILYMIDDSKMIVAMVQESFGMVDELIERGMAYQTDSIEELAEVAELDAETLASTIETFNSSVDTENDAEFGRTSINGKVEERPYYAVKLQMAYHLTFGGLIVDEYMHVLDSDNNVISGLYAGGDILGGFEGDTHQSGPCMSIVIYSGREAGINAAAGN